MKKILLTALFMSLMMNVAYGKALNKDVKEKVIVSQEKNEDDDEYYDNSQKSSSEEIKSTKKSSSGGSGGTRRTSTRRSSSGGGSSRNFGIGFMTGTVTGLNMKFWNDGGTAIDLGVSWWNYRNNNYDKSDSTGLYLHGDYLFHNFAATRGGNGQFGFHYGPGLKFVSDGYLAVRFPLGADYIFQGSVADIFAEITPTLELVSGNHSTPRFYADAAIGARFYF